MTFSISSFLSALILGNLMIIILFIFYKFLKTVNKIHYSIIILFCIVVFLRLLLPLELFFTYTLPSSKIFPRVYDLLQYSVISLPSGAVKLYLLIMIIWMIGSLISLVRFLAQYVTLCNILSMLPVWHRLGKVNITKAALPNAPFSFGIRKLWIVLPAETMEIQDMNYILRHEIQHIRNKDPLIKFLFNIVCCIYWWNPIVYLLNNQLNYLIELRVDSIISEKWSQYKKIQYINCLCKMSSRYRGRASPALRTPFSVSYKPTLLNRIEYFVDRPPKTSLFLSSFIIILMIYMLFGITLEPYRHLSLNHSETLSGTDLKQEAYIVRDQNNTYKLYIDGRFIAIVTDLSLPDFKDLKIYDKK